MPLRGRTALVTGGGRRGGIGHATACRLAAYGAAVVVHHFAPHDAAQPWGADDVDDALAEVRTHATAPVAGVHADLADPSAPQWLLDTARELAGPVDLLVANQALSGSDGPLGELSVELDRHWAVDARASILLVQAWANAHDDTVPGVRPSCSPRGRHAGRCPVRWPTPRRRRPSRGSPRPWPTSSRTGGCGSTR
ncbi:SDR family NAD(P)-dependent oxidoreductase [Pseudonocardia sp. ICBG601]|uniref:SDR family NAD(P)-dependent oxidoreductase n=1 Tax=Pseudonocardia sp. ICBG601 TaxID=2846759 RepID=UPI0035AC2075